jgi:hypothetical protein
MAPRLIRSRVLAAAIALSAILPGGARAAEPFTLASTTFQNGGPLPGKVANDVRGSCGGQNVSPQLAWKGAPEGTRSFVLIIFDPQGKNGLGDFGFVAYGIPATVTSFMEGEISSPSDKFVGGANSLGRKVYSGPCPPRGATHHYSFVLIATDLEPDALPPGLPVEALLPKIEGHARGSTGIVGQFAEP